MADVIKSLPSMSTKTITTMCQVPVSPERCDISRRDHKLIMKGVLASGDTTGYGAHGMSGTTILAAE